MINIQDFRFGIFSQVLFLLINNLLLDYYYILCRGFEIIFESYVLVLLNPNVLLTLSYKLINGIFKSTTLI